MIATFLLVMALTAQQSMLHGIQRLSSFMQRLHILSVEYEFLKSQKDCG